MKTIWHLLGAPGVGKGYCVDHLRPVMPNAGFIIMGDLVRARRKNDALFDHRYGPDIDSGELVPDHEAIPMMEEALHCLPTTCTHIITDGWLRTPAQVDAALRMVMLNHNSGCLKFRAEKRVLETRIHNRLVRLGRTDDHLWGKRIGIYYQNEPGVHHRLLRTQTEIFDIDANGELPTVYRHAEELIAPTAPPPTDRLFIRQVHLQSHYPMNARSLAAYGHAIA